MKKLLKIGLPVVAVVAALAFYFFHFASQPQVAPQKAEVRIPLVNIAPARAQSMNIPLFTRGTVTPSTQIHLVSEVSGQIVEISPNFSAGGFFKRGEILVRVDTLEYDVMIKRGEAAKAQAYQTFLQAKAERKARSMGRSVQGNTLASFEVQVRQAEAHYLATSSELDAMKKQRERTTIRAPFDGRVLTAGLNIGQFLRPGAQMGVIYAVDVAEVRLPLSDRQLGLVDVPGRMSDQETLAMPEVLFTEEFAGKTFTWKGQVVRTEGGVDERNRLLYVVAHVPDPYGIDARQPGRPELVAGSFVEAKIAGRKFERVFAIPRKALRNGNEVWVVTDDSRLSKREIGILHKEKDTVYINTGIDDGEQVVLNQLDIAVEGMRVRTQLQDNPDQVESEVVAGDNPFAGGRQVAPAIAAPPAPAAREPKAMTINISEEKARDLADKAKDYYDDLDDEQKAKLKDNAMKLGKQFGALQDALKTPVPAQTAPSPKAKTQPDTASSAPSAAAAKPAIPATQPEQPTPSTAGASMSPLAEQLEQDLARQAPAASEAAAAAAPEVQSTPEPAAPVEPEPQTSAAQPVAGTGSKGAAGVIATVSAPKPLVESSQ